MNIYWSSIEFDILKPDEYEDCIGGFVYMFAAAKDKHVATAKMQAAIEEEDFKVKEIEFVSRYEGITWDEKEDQVVYDGLAKEAADSQEIIWDEISAYEAGDD